MKPRTFTLLLADKKEYVFSERHREDTSSLALYESLRRNNMRMIQEEIKNSDERVTMLLSEMRRSYSHDEVNAFIASNEDELYKVCFNAFKINNPDIPFDEFKKLLKQQDVRHVAQLVKENDFPEVTEEKKKLKATPSQKK